MNKQSFVYTVVFTAVVSFVFVLLLAIVNEVTADQVRFNQEVRLVRSVLNAMGVEFDDDEHAAELFQRVEQVEIVGLAIYRYEREDETLYAKEYSGGGLWGPIRGHLGISADAERTLGLTVLEHEETPGLGGRIDEGWFQEQFRNKRLVDGRLRMTSRDGQGDFDEDSGEIDGITGATTTSRSMERIINIHLEELTRALGGAT